MKRMVPVFQGEYTNFYRSIVVNFLGPIVALLSSMVILRTVGSDTAGDFFWILSILIIASLPITSWLELYLTRKWDPDWVNQNLNASSKTPLIFLTCLLLVSSGTLLLVLFSLKAENYKIGAVVLPLLLIISFLQALKRGIYNGKQKNYLVSLHESWFSPLILSLLLVILSANRLIHLDLLLFLYCLTSVSFLILGYKDWRGAIPQCLFHLSNLLESMSDRSRVVLYAKTNTIARLINETPTVFYGIFGEPFAIVLIRLTQRCVKMISNSQQISSVYFIPEIGSYIKGKKTDEYRKKLIKGYFTAMSVNAVVGASVLVFFHFGLEPVLLTVLGSELGRELFHSMFWAVHLTVVGISLGPVNAFIVGFDEHEFRLKWELWMFGGQLIATWISLFLGSIELILIALPIMRIIYRIAAVPVLWKNLA
jgi:hypothetical protein